MATLTERTARPERKPLPPPNSDFCNLAETWPREELAVVKQVRAFMESKVAPIATKYWADDAFPFELLPAFKELNLGGVGMQGYGCRGGSALLFGLVAMEMSRVDSSIATFFGVHNGLAMGSIYLGGSEEQKQKWLPPMARMDKIGCFGLTEPLVGSGSGGGLLTTAKREGDTWILNGQKRLQFGKPIGSFQLVQDLLARMLANVTACQCMVARTAQLQAEGKLGDHHAALAKAFTTARMRETVAWAREIFGGNGIVLDYDVARFFADSEALYSYEGTYQMQNLIIGKAITGLSAFV